MRAIDAGLRFLAATGFLLLAAAPRAMAASSSPLSVPMPSAVIVPLGFADTESAKRACQAVQEGFTAAYKSAPRSDCVLGGASVSSSDLEVRVERDSRQRLKVTFANRNTELLGEAFTNVVNRIERGAWDTQGSRLRAFAQRLANAVRLRKVHEEVALIFGLRESKRIRITDGGEYVDTWTKQVISFDDARTIFVQETPRQKHYWRAALEMFTLIGPIGQTWYWTDKDINRPDWELGFDRESWRRKLVTFDAVRFDNNSLKMNAFKHPLVEGAAFWFLARTNNLDPLSSMLMSATASLLWEYLGEFREMPSINDIIVTPVAGAAFGEVIYQLGEFFARAEPNFINTTLSLILGSTRRAHDYFDKARGRQAAPGSTDKYGFPSDVWHRFDLYVGLENIKAVSLDGQADERQMIEVGLETEIVTLPGYRRPGRVSKFHADGNFTKFLARLGYEGDERRNFLVYAEAALAGYHYQNVVAQPGPEGSMRGFSFYVGAATAYDYGQRVINGFADNVAIVNVIGPMMDMVIFRGQAKIRLKIGVYGDFAQLTSYGYEKIAGGPTTKSILELRNYYFAFGITAAPELTFEIWDIRAGISARYDAVRSIQGKDRHQESIQFDGVSTDGRLTSRVFADFPLFLKELRLGVSAEVRRRWGSHGDNERETIERVVQANLRYVF